MSGLKINIWHRNLLLFIVCHILLYYQNLDFHLEVSDIGNGITKQRGFAHLRDIRVNSSQRIKSLVKLFLLLSASTWFNDSSLPFAGFLPLFFVFRSSAWENHPSFPNYAPLPDHQNPQKSFGSNAENVLLHLQINTLIFI